MALKAYRRQRVFKNDHHNIIVNQKHVYIFFNDPVETGVKKEGNFQTQGSSRMDLLGKARQPRGLLGLPHQDF